MKIFLQIIVFLLIGSGIYAQTHCFVNASTGNDNTGNGSAGSPWATIEYAVNNVTNPSTDQITINISGDIYDLSNDQIDINRNFINLTLLGAGIDNTIVQSAADTSLSTSRVFKIYAGNKVTLKKITIKNGKNTRYGGGIFNDGGSLHIDNCLITDNLCGQTGVGAGICNVRGNLKVINSTISYNTALDSCYGGGIGSVDGDVDISNSTIANNSSPGGGGIAIISINNAVTFNITNSTIYENTATYFCGGIRVDRFNNDFSIITNIINCTIFKNNSTGIYGIGGLGILKSSTNKIKNSIIAGNLANPSGISPDIGNFGTINSGGYNLIGNTSGSQTTWSSNDIINPALIGDVCQPLADNNTTNSTQTCATLLGSPAIDAIPGGNGAPLLDQRGYQRVWDYDIGAYEFSSISVVDEDKHWPGIFSLEQNYPNPFNPSTKIRYTIPTPPISSPLVKGRTEEGFVSLKIYDVLGNEIAILVDEYKPAGTYEVEFSAIGGSASGVYFYQLRAGDYLEIKKMMLIK